MNEEELYSEIIKLILQMKKYGKTPSWLADQILTLIREAGWKSPEEVSLGQKLIEMAKDWGCTFYCVCGESQNLDCEFVRVVKEAT